MTHSIRPLIAALAASLAWSAGITLAQEVADADESQSAGTGGGQTESVVIQLVSGTRIAGEIVEETGDTLTLRNSELGEILIPEGQIAARLAPDAPLGPKAPAPEEAPPPGLFGTSFLAGWEKSVALGISGKSADTDEVSFTASVEGDYADDDKRWKLRSAYFYGELESTTSKNEGFANLRRDWLVPDQPWFIWAEGRTDYNDFQAWQFRAGGFAGLGASLFDTDDTDSFRESDDLQVLGRIGAGYQYEFGQVDDGTPEAVAAIEARYKISENQTLRFAHTYFPSLEDLPESRNVTEGSYLITIDRGRGLSLKFGIFNEYLSMTADDSVHNSLNYFAQLQYSF
jgi:hypothetical protein